MSVLALRYTCPLKGTYTTSMDLKLMFGHSESSFTNLQKAERPVKIVRTKFS